jgi:hypothetical protein
MVHHRARHLAAADDRAAPDVIAATPRDHHRDPKREPIGHQ